jgi:hypothetical protein
MCYTDILQCSEFLGPADKRHNGEPHCTLVLSSDVDSLEVHNDVSLKDD